MHRPGLPLVAFLSLMLCRLFYPQPVEACEKCTQKLRCIGDTCWMEYACVGNLRYPQIGHVSCDPEYWGCDYGASAACLWAGLPQAGEKTPSKPMSCQCAQT